MARADEAGTYLTEFVYHKAEVPEVWLKSTHLRVQKVLRIDLDISLKNIFAQIMASLKRCCLAYLLNVL